MTVQRAECRGEAKGRSKLRHHLLLLLPQLPLLPLPLLPLTPLPGCPHQAARASTGRSLLMRGSGCQPSLR